jgi:hypothetical protein
MAWRVIEREVREVVETSSSQPMAPHIAAANALTDKVSAEDDNSVLNAALLKQIELYLAAHFYALRDPQYQQETTLRAGARYQGQTGMGLDATWWGQQAKVLDVSGYLASLDSGKRAVAGMAWLGLPPSEQTDYVDRD